MVLIVSGNASCNVGNVKCTCPNGGCIRSALSGQWLLQLGQPSPCTGTITQVDYQLYSNSSVEYEAQIVIAVWRPAEPGVYDRVRPFSKSCNILLSMHHQFTDFRFSEHHNQKQRRYKQIIYLYLLVSLNIDACSLSFVKDPSA